MLVILAMGAQPFFVRVEPISRVTWRMHSKESTETEPATKTLDLNENPDYAPNNL
jgi:hypothetical protein